MVGWIKIALLQAEVSACVSGLANVLFVRWVFIIFIYVSTVLSHER